MPRVKQCVDFLDVLKEIKRETAYKEVDEFQEWATEELSNCSFVPLEYVNPTECLYDSSEHSSEWEHEWQPIYNYIAYNYGKEIVLLWDY